MEAYSVQSNGDYDPLVRETLIGTANEYHEK